MDFHSTVSAISPAYKKVLVFGCAVLSLAGCTTTSGVMRASSDDYTIATTASMGAGGASAAKRNAYAEASQECARQNKSVSSSSERTTAPSWTDGMYTVNLTFECK